MTMWCLWGAGWLGASHVLGLLMHHGMAMERHGGHALRIPLQRWRRHPRQPAIGLGLVAATAVLAAFDTDHNYSEGMLLCALCYLLAGLAALGMDGSREVTA